MAREVFRTFQSTEAIAQGAMVAWQRWAERRRAIDGPGDARRAPISAVFLDEDELRELLERLSEAGPQPPRLRRLRAELELIYEAMREDG